MVNEHLKLKYWIVNHMQIIYITFSFGRSFVIKSRIFVQEMIKRYGRMTHLHKTNWIRR